MKISLHKLNIIMCRLIERKLHTNRDIIVLCSLYTCRQYRIKIGINHGIENSL